MFLDATRGLPEVLPHCSGEPAPAGMALQLRAMHMGTLPHPTRGQDISRPGDIGKPPMSIPSLIRI